MQSCDLIFFFSNIYFCLLNIQYILCLASELKINEFSIVRWNQFQFWDDVLYIYNRVANNFNKCKIIFFSFINKFLVLKCNIFHKCKNDLIYIKIFSLSAISPKKKWKFYHTIIFQFRLQYGVGKAKNKIFFGLLPTNHNNV